MTAENSFKDTKEEKQLFTAKDITLIAMFAAFIAVCSYISIPLGPVPFTLQTFAVFVVAAILGTKRGTLTVIIYILVGAIGIPVFNGAGGVGVLAGSTGGYILGFILTALTVGLMNDYIKLKNHGARMALMAGSMLIGDVLCFIVGTIHFMNLTEMNLATSLSYCVIPFIIPDIAKIIVATIFVDRVKKYVRL
ncbi:MAG: biotin transporter BioY [Lachnospiraceae bacterium]|nr:biotin transporter BioY [Lachnospiraceae bacterium]